MRVPESGSRQLLRPVRGTARQGRAGLGDHDELHARGSRGGWRGGRLPRGSRGGRACPGRAFRWRARGGALRPAGRQHHDRPLAGLRHLPRRRHGLPQARGSSGTGRRLLHRGPGEPQRHLPEPKAHRVVGKARERRRAPDRQVQAHLPGEMTTAAQAERQERTRLLTIGAVCRRLQAEFPDISISKIRYLEDQGLLAPRRTQSGYRLFSDADVERLETILRLQRDEFLPLRVIRQELASPSGAGKDRRRRRGAGLADPSEELELGELCERAAIAPELARELEDYGLLQPRRDGGGKVYPAGDVEIAIACAKLARYGITARHLRSFRTAADRKAALLEQLVAPSLRSRNAERREAGIQQLQTLAELAQELSQLLFWRDLRQVAGS